MENDEIIYEDCFSFCYMWFVNVIVIDTVIKKKVNKVDFFELTNIFNCYIAILVNLFI